MAKVMEPRPRLSPGRPNKLMIGGKMRLSFVLLPVMTFLLLACDGPKQTVSKFLDAVISKQPYSQYLAPGSITAPVTDYYPISYEIKNNSDSAVSALIIFRGSRPNGAPYMGPNSHSRTTDPVDIPQTHIFLLSDGKIKEIN
jgi:hypothetical protein